MAVMIDYQDALRCTTTNIQQAIGGVHSATLTTIAMKLTWPARSLDSMGPPVMVE